MDICMAYMPYAPVTPPPLGISLLAAQAREAGLSVKVVYPTFWFAERIGYFTYQAISSAVGGFEIAEWTFSKAAFPRFDRDGRAFLDAYLDRQRHEGDERYDLLFRDEDAFRRRCIEVQQAAAAFVADAAQRIMECCPRIVACGSTYYQNCASLALLCEIKALDGNVVTLLGGSNCEGTMGQVMRRAFPWVDFAVSGDADELFVPLCRLALEHGRDIPQDDLPRGVLGPDWDSDGEAPVAVVSRLGALPVPDFDDYLEALKGFHYRGALPPPSLSIETARGCWWKEMGGCTFCGGNGKRVRYRAKPAESLLQELRALHERYSINRFIATDSILDMSYFDTVLRELSASQPPAYDIFLSAKGNLTEDHCRRIRAAGVHRLQPGIESLHDDVLRLLNKGCTAAGNVALLKYAYENGIKLTWNVLVDIPGERDEWYGETAAWVPLLVHLQPPHKIMSIHFDRFSRYVEQPEAYGLELEPLPWYSHIFPLSGDDLAAFAYSFEDRNAPRDRPPSAGRQSLEEALLDWMRLHASSGDGPPRLTARVEGKESVLLDTRPCSEMREVILTGMEDRVHRACRQPRTLEAICSEVDPGGNRERVEAAVGSLCKRKLVLRLGSRYIALALREPLTPFVHPPDYNLPRLQSAIEAAGTSYWGLLQQMDRRLGQ